MTRVAGFCFREMHETGVPFSEDTPEQLQDGYKTGENVCGGLRMKSGDVCYNFKWFTDAFCPASMELDSSKSENGRKSISPEQ